MKKVMLILSLFFLSFLSFGQAGPLTGALVINKGEITARWDDPNGDRSLINYVFKVKNSGNDPIKILKIIPSCGCQDSDPKNIQTIQPGQYGDIKIQVTVSKEQLSKDLKNGIIEYDRAIVVETNGQKPKYQLFAKAKIRIID